MRTLLIAVIAEALLATPGQAQLSGIVQSLNNLKATANQLTHKPQSTALGGGAQLVDAAPTTAGYSFGPTISQFEGADTNVATNPARPGVVASDDILGFKLGMSPKEANRLAVQLNLIPGEIDYGPSFQTMVKAKMSQTGLAVGGHEVVRYATPKMPDGSQLRQTFYAAPQGARISDVVYLFPKNGHTFAELLQKSTAKYGKPKQIDTSFNTASWCDGQCIQTPTLSAQEGQNEMIIALHEGAIALDEHTKAVEAEANSALKSAHPLAKF